MSFFDLNEAEASTGATSGEPIPDGTVARAVLAIRPGGAGDGGWCKTSKAGDLMLDCEFTLADGPFARRKVWTNMMVTGSEKAVAITKRHLRAIVEGHHGLRPDDLSEAAQAKRRVQIADLTGMECCILIGIETQPGYAPKNTLKAVIAPGEGKFIGKAASAPLGEAPQARPANVAPFAAPPASAAPAPAQSPAGRPAWAS